MSTGVVSEIMVRTGKAKDYRRGNNVFEYYSIIVNHIEYFLDLGGWTGGLPVYTEAGRRYIVVDAEKYYLQESNAERK